MRSFVWFSYFLPELWSLNCQKLCPFSIFTDVSNKSKAVIAVYVYAFESSRFALLENGIGYYAMTYSLEDGEFHLKMVHFVKILLIQHFFLMFYSSVSRELLFRPL